MNALASAAVNTMSKGMALIALTLLSACGGGGSGGDGGAGTTTSAPGPQKVAPTPGTLQFSAATYSVNESAGSATLQITRTGGSDTSVVATVSLTAGTATAGQDFTATPASVTFVEGDAATKSVTIPIVNDAAVEAAESFTATLSLQASSLATLGSPSTTTVTIQNDDIASGVLKLSAASYSVSEGGGSIVVGIDRVDGSTGAVSATLATQNGVATAGQDFTAVNTTVSFANNDSTRKTISIPILDDALNEPDEAFTVTLSSPTGGASIGTPSSATITIAASDTPPPPPGPAGALQMSAATLNVSESGPFAIVTVTRTSGTSGAVTAQIATGDGTAVAGVDYTTVGATVSFADGDAVNKTVSIPILNDSTPEVQKSFSVSISSPTGGATLGATTATTVTIVNDDRPVAPTLNVTTDIRQLKFTWNTVPFGTTYKLRENLDGVSGFTQVGSNFTTATTSYDLDISTFKFNWNSALYRIDACNEVGCTASASVSPASGMLASIGYFKAPVVDSDDHFATTLAMSADGSTIVVGVPDEDSNATGIDGDDTDDSRTDSGAVYIYVKTNGVWARQAYLKASNAAAGDKFGSALSISTDGDTLAVAAPHRTADSGAVYVFVRSNGVWMQEAAVTAPFAGAGDLFGAAMSLSTDGNALLVGAPGEDSNATWVNGAQFNNSSLGSGAAYTYTRSGTVWSFANYFKATNTGAGDAFGTSVAIGNGFIAVGAPGEDSDVTGSTNLTTLTAPLPGNNNNRLDSGAVYVYYYVFGEWRASYIKSLNSEAGDAFGSTLSMNLLGDTLAVGALGEDGNTNGVIYTLGVDATFLSTNFPADAAGCAGGTPGTAKCESGAVYVWSRVGNTWSQQAYIKASNRETSDAFGSALALSADGNALVVGNVNEDSGSAGIGGDQTSTSAAASGAAYFFNRIGTNWSQRNYLKATNTEASDVFGASVAIDWAGDTIAVGATAEDSVATLIGGNQSDNSLHDAGAFYLY